MTLRPRFILHNFGNSQQAISDFKFINEIRDRRNRKIARGAIENWLASKD